MDMECHLLQLAIIEQEGNKLIPFNGNPKLVAAPDVLNQFDGAITLSHHKRMINDLAWAPIAGRSFHLLASASKDRTVIVWRLVLIDILTQEQL